MSTEKPSGYGTTSCACVLVVLMVSLTTAAAIVDDSVVTAFLAFFSGPYIFSIYMTLGSTLSSHVVPRLLGLVFDALTLSMG